MSQEQQHQSDETLVVELKEAVTPVSDAEKTSMIARAARVRARVAVGDAIMTESRNGQ